MNNFATSLKSRIRGVYKPKARPSRPAKLQELRKEAEEGVSLASVSSAASIATTQSYQSASSRNFQPNDQAKPSSPSSFQDGSTTSGLERANAIPVAEQMSGDLAADSTEANKAHCSSQAVKAEDGVEQVDTEEPITLLPEEQQAIREQTYITFNGEDQDDYTEGPVRMILAADGVKRCAALLMTLDLSSKIQRALKLQKDLAKARRRALRQTEVNLHFGFDLDSQIASHKSRLAMLSQAETPDEVLKSILQEELLTLELVVEENAADRQTIQNNLEFKGQILRDIQEEANAAIDEAFIRAHLVEPEDDSPDIPIESLDLQTEYQAFLERLKAMNDDIPIPASPLHTDRDHMVQDPMTEEQELIEKLKEALWTAHQRIQSAQNAFDRREADRAEELNANVDAAARGEQTTDDTPDDFDLRWLKQEQKLTRELIEAEEYLAEVKAAITAAGMDLTTDDQASGFLDNVADGYRVSFEQEHMASVPLPTVNKWLTNIAEAASPSFNDRSEDSDEWEAEDVGISDSVSVVAEGPERRRIDKRRKVCGL